MSKPKIDAEELVRRILRFDEDFLRDDYPKALIEAELRDAGADPDEIGREGEAFVKKLIAERAEVESRKPSRTRLRSSTKTTTSSSPPRVPSSLPPTRSNAPSESGPINEE